MSEQQGCSHAEKDALRKMIGHDLKAYVDRFGVVALWDVFTGAVRNWERERACGIRLGTSKYKCVLESGHDGGVHTYADKGGSVSWGAGLEPQPPSKSVRPWDLDWENGGLLTPEEE